MIRPRVSVRDRISVSVSDRISVGLGLTKKSRDNAGTV